MTLNILSEDLISVIFSPESLIVIAAADEDGSAGIYPIDLIDVIDQSFIAFAQPFEGSPLNSYLLKRLWFGGKVSVCVKSADKSFVFDAHPYKYSHTGQLFLDFYKRAREKWGGDSDLAGIWTLHIDAVRDESYSARKSEEDEKHPFFRHLDRTSVRI